MNFQGRLGVLLTILLITSAVAVLVYKDFVLSISELQPNEVGDFLAGIFAPIALCWIVLGYYQQAKELRENTDALRKQGEESNKHTVAFNAQLELLSSQLTSQKQSVFFDSYNIRYNELAFRAASILRASQKHKRWEINLDWFGKGYVDVFCNALKNKSLDIGREKFLKEYDRCFSDNREQLKYYISTFEEFLRDAEVVDKHLRIKGSE